MVNSRAFAMALIAITSVNARASQATQKPTQAPTIPAKPSFSTVVASSSSALIAIPATSTESKEEKKESSTILPATFSSSANTVCTEMPTQQITHIEMTDGFLNKIGNFLRGTDQNVVAELKAMKEHQVLKADSVTNQKIIASAVINLIDNNDPNSILEFINLASQKKQSCITAQVDKTPRKSIRKWLQEHRNQKDQELISFYIKQTESLKKEYTEKIKYLDSISAAIDSTYELGGESDNEEEHPAYVDSTQLIKTRSTELSVMKPSNKQQKNVKKTR